MPFGLKTLFRRFWTWRLNSNLPFLKQKLKNQNLKLKKFLIDLPIQIKLYISVVIIVLLVLSLLLPRLVRQKTKPVVETNEEEPAHIEVTAEPIPSYEEAFPKQPPARQEELPGRKLTAPKLSAKERLELDNRLDQGNNAMQESFSSDNIGGSKP